MVIALFYLVLAVLVAHAAYWIIRLAVRHGIQDVQSMTSPVRGARPIDRPSDLIGVAPEEKAKRRPSGPSNY